MRKRKKYLKLLLLVGGLLMLQNHQVFALEGEECYFQNNNDICMTEEEYNTLTNLGFTAIEIRTMDLEEFNANKNLDGQVSAENSKYVQTMNYYDRDGDLLFSENRIITEEEVNSEPETPPFSLYADVISSVQILNKKLTTTIITSNDMHRYKATIEWLNNPTHRYYDLLGIGFQSSRVYESGHLTFRHTYCVSVSSCQTNGTSSAIFNIEPTGIGASFKLQSGTYDIYFAYMYFDVEKVSNDTLYDITAASDYKHAVEETTALDAQEYNINMVGIHPFSSIEDKYEDMEVVEATWYGTW